MGTLVRFDKVAVVVRAPDHNPPHFHVSSPDFDAVVEIKTLTILAGSLPRAVADVVMAWAVANRALIAAEWNRVNPKYPL